MKYPDVTNNGEIQPLMMKMVPIRSGSSNDGSEGDTNTYQEHTSPRRRIQNKRRQQTKTFKIYCFAFTAIAILFGLVAFILAVLNKESEYKKQQADRRREKRDNRTYSQKANENLQHLFNDPSSSKKYNVKVGCQGTVLIMPSCESNLNEDRCNFVGLERSFYLITMFGKDKRWPVPLDIFVLGSSAKRQRAVETVMPLQIYNRVHNRTEPTIYSKRKDLVRDVSSLIRSGIMCGSIVTVTAADEYEMPLIASDLGCGPLNAGAGCPTVFDGDFDSVWELRFVYDEQGDEGIDDDDNGDNGNSSVGGDNSGNTEEGGLKWRVYGSVVKENFDPLAFSKLVGEYNASDMEVKVDPRWMNMTLYDHLP